MSGSMFIPQFISILIPLNINRAKNNITREIVYDVSV